MEPEIFDYGDEEDSSRQNNNTASELGDIFGPPDTDQPRTSVRTNAGLDMRVTVQVVVAVILLVVAGGLLARDAWSRRARDTAFHQVIEANSKRDYLRVIQAAESFLTHQSVNGGRDAREDGVVSLYSEALVHWVAQQPGQLDANAHARVARYKQLVKSPAK
jgi:hypothetical protein